MNNLENVIGFIGKSGSGKSHLANVLSEISGIPVIDHSEVTHKIKEMPIVRQFIDYKCKKLNIGGNGHKVIDFIGEDDLFLRAQFFFLKHILNFKLKQKIEPEKPVIIAFQALPMLTITQSFGQKVRIFNPNEDERLSRISLRDNIPLETVKKRTENYERFLNFDGIKYDHEFKNTGNGLPDGFLQYAENLKFDCNSEKDMI